MSKLSRTWKRAATVGCVVLAGVTSRSAMADIQTGKYGAAQVFDVQRSPALPSAGVPFTAFSFAPPYDHLASPHPMNPGEYVQLVQVSASPCSHAIDLFAANGTLILRLQDGGDVYGLDSLGFLHVSDVSAGTFVANSAGYSLGGSLTYTPTTGLVTCGQLTAYVPSTIPLATPTAGVNIPTLSEWGMIIFAGMMAVLAFAAMRRSNSLTPG